MDAAGEVKSDNVKATDSQLDDATEDFEATLEPLGVEVQVVNSRVGSFTSNDLQVLDSIYSSNQSQQDLAELGVEIDRYEELREQNPSLPALQVTFQPDYQLNDSAIARNGMAHSDNIMSLDFYHTRERYREYAEDAADGRIDGEAILPEDVASNELDEQTIRLRTVNDLVAAGAPFKHAFFAASNFVNSPAIQLTTLGGDELPGNLLQSYREDGGDIPADVNDRQQLADDLISQLSAEEVADYWEAGAFNLIGAYVRGSSYLEYETIMAGDTGQTTYAPVLSTFSGQPAAGLDGSLAVTPEGVVIPEDAAERFEVMADEILRQRLSALPEDELSRLSVNLESGRFPNEAELLPSIDVAVPDWLTPSSNDPGHRSDINPAS